MGLPLMPMSSAQANSGNSCFAEGLANVALHKAVLPDLTAANLVRVDAAAITAGLVQKHCGLQYHAFIAGYRGHIHSAVGLPLALKKTTGWLRQRCRQVDRSSPTN